MSNNPRSEYPSNLEIDYYNDLKANYDTWINELTNNLDSSIFKLSFNQNSVDKIFDDKRKQWDLLLIAFIALLSKYTGSLTNKKIDTLSKQIGNKFFKNEDERSLNKTFIKMRIINQTKKNLEDKIKTFQNENQRLIKSLGNNSIDRLQNNVNKFIDRYIDTPNSRSNNFIDGRKVLEDIINSEISKSDKSIALNIRNQIGNLNALINKTVDMSMGIKEFYWISMRDERVRPVHVHLDNGESYSYTNPPSEGIAGEPLNCRCFPESNLTNFTF